MAKAENDHHSVDQRKSKLNSDLCTQIFFFVKDVEDVCRTITPPGKIIESPKL